MRVVLTLFLAAITALLVAAPAMAQGSPTAEETQSGTCIDQAADNCYAGAWSNTTPGVAGRPYLKYLAVTNNGTTTVVVDNQTGATQTPTPVAGTDLYAVVSPQNACKTGQAPAAGVCYDPPNRVSVYLEHKTAEGWTDNFTSSTSASPAITTSSVVDLIIGFHSAYSSLRWSWVNGVPSYWQNTVASGADGQVEVRFSPRTVPVMTGGGGCSQIPVSTCDIAQASEERLQPQVLFSMDTTLDAGLTGALFGTESAFIGSLEMSPAPPGGTPTLTYGIAAPHLNADGSPRVGALYALMSSQMLSLFSTSVAAFDSTILNVARTGDPGTSSSAWAPWAAAANGTEGEFLTVSNISFSAPKFQVTRSSKASSKLSIRVKQSIALSKIAAQLKLSYKRGAKLSATVSTKRICAVRGATIRGLAPGTCKGTLTVKPKKGKSSKKSFTLVVTKAGKRLPVALHR